MEVGNIYMVLVDEMRTNDVLVVGSKVVYRIQVIDDDEIENVNEISSVTIEVKIVEIIEDDYSIKNVANVVVTKANVG